MHLICIHEGGCRENEEWIKMTSKEALTPLKEIAEKLTRKQWLELTEKIETIRTYITQQEQFAKDVSRYFELDCSLTEDGVFHHRFVKTSKLENETISECEIRLETEYESLFEKLSKVGKEE